MFSDEIQFAIQQVYLLKATSEEALDEAQERAGRRTERFVRLQLRAQKGGQRSDRQSTGSPQRPCLQLPWIIGFLIFTLLPLGLTLYYSFCDYSLLQGPGLDGLGELPRTGAG